MVLPHILDVRTFSLEYLPNVQEALGDILSTT